VGGRITFNTAGIDFALTALFVVILIEQIKGASSKLPVFIGSLSSVAWILMVGADRFLLPSLLSTVAVLICFKKKLAADKEDA
jgi:4-azaleucine resistance transporter AzlC